MERLTLKTYSLPEDYEWISVAEYEFDWVYQPDGMRSLGVGEAPGEPDTQGQTGTGGRVVNVLGMLNRHINSTWQLTTGWPP